MTENGDGIDELLTLVEVVTSLAFQAGFVTGSTHQMAHPGTRTAEMTKVGKRLSEIYTAGQVAAVKSGDPEAAGERVLEATREIIMP